MGKFLKTWGGLAVATVALLASASAVYFDNAHFEETSIREQERDEELNQQHTVSVDLQQRRYDELNQQHTVSVGLQQRRYDELNQQHTVSVGLQQRRYDELNQQFKEVIEPKVRHDEILHYIKFLENRLESYWNWISALSGYQSEVGEAYYMKAARNYESAKRELMDRNFDLAEQLVKAANDNLDEGILAVASSNTTASVD